MLFVATQIQKKFLTKEVSFGKKGKTGKNSPLKEIKKWKWKNEKVTKDIRYQ